MAITRQTYRVWYEDGTSQDVVGDQRDVAAWERFSGMGFAKAQEKATVTALRQVAFFALKRTSHLPVPGATVAQWEQTVIEVEPVDEEVVDPTTAEASQTGPSSSPSALA